jgi:predicted RNA binding protein YcfA (HicA-like mRNA interferase family)
MAKREKLLARIRNNPRNVSMRDLQTLLNLYGFVQDRIAGSHYIFVGQVAGEGVTLVIPLQTPHIRAGYIKDVLAVIDQILAEQGEEGDEEDDAHQDT